MTRYERIIERLDHLKKIDPQSLRICKASLCACNGCAREVNGKWITQRELDLYLSGEMQKIANDQKKGGGGE